MLELTKNQYDAIKVLNALELHKNENTIPLIENNGKGVFELLGISEEWESFDKISKDPISIIELIMSEARKASKRSNSKMSADEILLSGLKDVFEEEKKKKEEPRQDNNSQNFYDTGEAEE